MDTIGTDLKCPEQREVSLIQRLLSTQMWDLGQVKVSILFIVVSLIQGGLIERFHCISFLTKMYDSYTMYRYITHPLLLDGRKFDIRVYLLVVAAKPYVVLYADGYVRLSCSSYNPASSDMAVHLTNQYQQKKHPDYSTMKEDTVCLLYIHYNISSPVTPLRQCPE